MTNTKKKYFKTASYMIAVIILITCIWFFQLHFNDIIEYTNGLGWFAPAFFLMLYCLASMMFLPTLLLTLAGGAIYGPILGTLLNIVGATLGAATSFLISRHLISDWFAKKRGEKFNTLVAGVDRNGWLYVALLRLFPVIPFNIVNYGLGVTGIKFRLYIITTFVFLLPAEIIYTYLGYAGINAFSSTEHFYRNTVIGVSGLAFLMFCIAVFLKRK